MSKILKFEEFFESYLKGSRQPLYHFTNHLEAILKTDLLKMSYPSRGEKSISFTRNIDFADIPDEYVLEIDVDKLHNDGIKTYPVDEIGIGLKELGDKEKNYSKSNFPEIKSGTRGTKHGLDLPTDFILETEFEERVFQDIPNLGKYILRIGFGGSSFKKTEYLVDYLEKYPHIELFEFSLDNHRKQKPINL